MSLYDFLLSILIFTHIYAVGAGATYTYLINEEYNGDYWVHFMASVFVSILWPVIVVPSIILACLLKIYLTLHRMRK